MAQWQINLLNYPKGIYFYPLMKKMLLIICLSSFYLSLAQPKYDGLEIVQGPLFGVKKRSVPTRFVGHDKSGFYIEYSKGKFGQGNLILQKFGYDLKPIKEQELSFNTAAGKAESWMIFKIGSKIYSCASSGSFIGKNFYFQEINSDNLNVGEPKLIGSVSSESSSVASLVSRIGFSKDSSFVSLIYTIPTRRADAEKLGVKTFDKNLEAIWENEYELPYTNKLLDPQKYLVTHDGSVFILAKRFFDKRREKIAGQVNYDYLLLKLLSDGSVDSINIQSEGKFLRGMNVDITPTGDVVSGGFYSEKGNALTGGAYYMRINGQTKEVVTSSFRPFDVDFFIANMKEKKAEKLKEKIEEGKDVELPSYYIDEFRTSADGSTQMIGEKRQITVNTVYSPYGSYTYYSYFYDDIAVVQIDPNGEIQWAERVAKKQHTTNDNAAYSSYGAMTRANETVFFFNDNAKNALYDGVGKVAAMAKGEDNMLMMVRMDKEGKMKRTGLMRQGDADIKIRPIFSHQLNEKEFLIFGHQGVKTQRFFLMSFK
jgi:hypothetical protein